MSVIFGASASSLRLSSFPLLAGLLLLLGGGGGGALLFEAAGGEGVPPPLPLLVALLAGLLLLLPLFPAYAAVPLTGLPLAPPAGTTFGVSSAADPISTAELLPLDPLLLPDPEPDPAFWPAFWPAPCPAP